MTSLGLTNSGDVIHVMHPHNAIHPFNSGDVILLSNPHVPNLVVPLSSPMTVPDEEKHNAHIQITRKMSRGENESSGAV